MITKFQLINPMEQTAPRNGKGTVFSFPYDILKGIEGKVKAFNHMRLEEDSAIGYHQHIDDLEIYIITEGTGIYNDNGKEIEVTVNDVMLCNKGEYHGIASKNGKLDFIAVIIG
ncbi:MAG: AraC family ligand binding domain-containing protein [Mucispirillum sp.]|nr:AraC family ligand binding domain-containing protein [Mucispirillum sp.]